MDAIFGAGYVCLGRARRRRRGWRVGRAQCGVPGGGNPSLGHPDIKAAYKAFRDKQSQGGRPSKEETVDGRWLTHNSEATPVKWLRIVRRNRERRRPHDVCELSHGKGQPLPRTPIRTNRPATSRERPAPVSPRRPLGGVWPRRQSRVRPRSSSTTESKSGGRPSQSTSSSPPREEHREPSTSLDDALFGSTKVQEVLAGRRADLVLVLLPAAFVPYGCSAARSA